MKKKSLIKIKFALMQQKKTRIRFYGCYLAFVSLEWWAIQYWLKHSCLLVKLTAQKGDWPLKMIVWNEREQSCLLMKLIVKDVNRWPILFLITCWLFCPALFRFKLLQNYFGISVNSIGAERLALTTNDYDRSQVNSFFSGQMEVQM